MMRGKVVLSNNGFKEVADALERQRKPKRAAISIGFVIFMAVLAVVCVGLGVWQINRLGEKEAMIAQVEERLSLDPVTLPPVAEWSAFDDAAYNFRPVKLEGNFVPGNTVMVFTSLANTKGTYEGAGYWVMSPFALAEGGTVIVNRGFIPQGAKSSFDGGAGEGASLADRTITGIARVSEKPNSFTPGPDIAGRVEYVRDLSRLEDMMDSSLEPFAKIYVDQSAGVVGELPQGGETVVSFPNRHLEYAWTWFSLAAVTIVMTLIWLFRQRRG